VLRFEPGTSITHSKSTNHSTVNTQCEIRGRKRKVGTKGIKKCGKKWVKETNKMDKINE
jgi:hypothetical protein